MSELELLNEIRKRPGMYLGEESITKLNAFLDGYNHANYLRGESRDEWVSGFQEFIDERYNNRMTIRWNTIILEDVRDEKKAFRRFFELLDEYLKHKDDKGGKAVTQAR